MKKRAVYYIVCRYYIHSTEPSFSCRLRALKSWDRREKRVGSRRRGNNDFEAFYSVDSITLDRLSPAVSILNYGRRVPRVARLVVHKYIMYLDSYLV